MLEKIFNRKRTLPNVLLLFNLIDWKSLKFKNIRNSILECYTIEDLKQLAINNVPRAVFDYVEGGSAQELSYQRSIYAFKRTEFRVKTLQNVSKIDTSQKLLGKMSDLPIIFAPTGYTQMMHHTGEPAVANVAVNRNLVYVLSTMGTTSPQELAEKVPNSRRWMQLYIMRNRKNTEKLILAAKNNGFEALMITVDTPVTGIKVRDLKNGLTVPPRIRLSTLLAIASKPKWWINLITTKKLEFAAFRGWDKPLSELAAEIFSPEITTKDIKWIKEIWKGPIIVKGIQSVEDAKKVVALGISALVVSNHGGRQLDRSPVPLEILSEIVKAVGTKVEVYLDGGVLSGQDVYAAIALGAKAVMIGRSYLYGIMAGGELGVNRVIDILDRDLRNTMALTGNINLNDVKKSGARIRNN